MPKVILLGLPNFLESLILSTVKVQYIYSILLKMCVYHLEQSWGKWSKELKKFKKFYTDVYRHSR